MQHKRVKRVYYTITELSKKLKVPTANIRYWQKHFNIGAKKGKYKLSVRRYNRKQTFSIIMIARLSKSGDLTLQGIGKKLKI